MAKVSLEKDKIKFLLVEGVHQKALESLRAAGYTNIEFHKGALDDEQLKESIRDAHFIGLRSRTHLTEDVINAAEKLVAIGCFCIGTNQVDLDAAAKRGIPVFNAPFSNTRSVAELVIGELLLLLRGVPEVSLPLHGGRRLMHIHENRPGVLTALNKIFAEQGVNIAAQYLQTSAQMGYVVIDIEADEDVAEKALQAMKAIPGTIRARLLY